ncbi:zinc metalloprotease HtpX [Geoalkalibacter sp.]|uniref:zinc metalloprotease HtpX n=1 Tax=Geoalkalibacter sp. TaxID=3041440 RepID=UPI00272EB6D7|nr:zinc metalloprotease HtpX [Geoalkalibacter sp.]
MNFFVRHALINRLHTLALLLFLGGYLALLGWLLWGKSGLIWLLLLGGLFALFSPAASPHLVMRLYRARPLGTGEAPQLYRLTHELSRRAGLATPPRLYYLPTAMVNAFAVGTRRHAALGLTSGLLGTLDRRELTGVLAHEISHIRNNDIRVMSLADMATRLTSILSTTGQILLLVYLPMFLFTDMRINWMVVWILLFAPQLSALTQLGLSRVREYQADLFAAELTGDPEGLARALIKLERSQRSLWQVLFPGYRIPEPSLLRTHPATEERVRRLMQLAHSSRSSVNEPFDEGADLWLEPVSPQRKLPRWHINGLWH